MAFASVTQSIHAQGMGRDRGVPHPAPMASSHHAARRVAAYGTGTPAGLVSPDLCCPAVSCGPTVAGRVAHLC